MGIGLHCEFLINRRQFGKLKATSICFDTHSSTPIVPGAGLISSGKPFCSKGRMRRVP